MGFFVGSICCKLFILTILNYFKNRLKDNQPVILQNAQRYLVTEDEFLHWVKMIPDWSCEMNIPGKRLHVKQIFKSLL